MKYKMHSFPLPEIVSSNLACDEVLQTFVTRVCFEYISLHYFSIFHSWKNIWPYWWIGPIVGGIICHSDSLTVMDVRVCVCVWVWFIAPGAVYGCVSEYVWESNSLLRWPWEQLTELLVHKITMKTEGDELTECVYVSIYLCVMSGKVFYWVILCSECCDYSYCCSDMETCNVNAII